MRVALHPLVINFIIFFGGSMKVWIINQHGWWKGYQNELDILSFKIEWESLDEISIRIGLIGFVLCWRFQYKKHHRHLPDPEDIFLN